jgi:hypothetical protein
MKDKNKLMQARKKKNVFSSKLSRGEGRDQV